MAFFRALDTLNIPSCLYIGHSAYNNV